VSAKVRIARYDTNAELPRHFHSHPRLCLILRGRFEEEESGSVWMHQRGELLFRPPHMRHRQRFGPTGAVCALIDPDVSWMAAARTLSVDLSRSMKMSSADTLRLAAVLMRESNAPDRFSAIACEAAAWECLALVGRSTAQAPPSFRDVHIALEFLHARIDGSIRLKDVAQAAGVHASTLARHFRRTCGSSVETYLRRLRLERAANLLEHGALPIAEVAIACGFADQAHFTTLFRRIVGTTPAEFRRQRRT
jgi:AraC family transcriptional regulator